MNPEISFCLMTCGEATESSCLRAVSEARSMGKFVFQEVRQITPAVVALNVMMRQCRTPYLVPLDADMILYPDYWERISQQLSRLQGDDSWHSILFPLWDTLTEEKILALKVLHMKVVGHLLFRDDPCPDITHYQEMESAGLRCINLFHEEPIGDHVVEGDYFCYAKYRDLYMVHRTHPQSFLPQHFKGGNHIKERAKNHWEFFQKRISQNSSYRYCLAGMVAGLTEPLRYASKDLGDRPVDLEKRVEEASRRFWEWYDQNKADRIFL